MNGSLKMSAELSAAVRASNGTPGVEQHFMFCCLLFCFINKNLTSLLNRETTAAHSISLSLLLQNQPTKHTHTPTHPHTHPSKQKTPDSYLEARRYTLREESPHFCLVLVPSSWASVGPCESLDCRLNRAGRATVIKLVRRQMSSSRSVTIAVFARAASCASSVLGKVRANLDHQLSALKYSNEQLCQQICEDGNWW